jgi:hypothetical protein
VREQNDPSGLPEPPPPCGPGTPGKPAVRRRRDRGTPENRPNSGVADERTRNDPAEKVPPKAPAASDINDLT